MRTRRPPMLVCAIIRSVWLWKLVIATGRGGAGGVGGAGVVAPPLEERRDAALETPAAVAATSPRWIPNARAIARKTALRQKSGDQQFHV